LGLKKEGNNKYTYDELKEIDGIVDWEVLE
jgi:hypothetical protein